jgi:hypothetical protein
VDDPTLDDSTTGQVDDILHQLGDFESRPQDPDGENFPMRHYLLLAAILLLTCAASAWAGPPSYLLLRPVEAPDPHDHWGEPPATFYDARATGYAYGYFGAGPRTHWSRHFGVQRMYTQWSKW